MAIVKKAFKNYFESEEITDARLVNYANDTNGRLAAANENNQYDAIMQGITTASNALDDNLGDVKGALAQQKGKTFTVDGVIKNFKTYMSENEGVIAKALGGKKTPAFIEFYPLGVSQYSTVTKSKLPALLGQLTMAIDNNKTKLGKDLVTELQQFEVQYETTRKAQTTQKGKVSDSRTDRSQERKNLEIKLLVAMYTIGLQYAGDEEKCNSFFNYSLLEAPSRKTKKEDKKETK